MIPFPKKKYQIIYADPPWSYNDKRTKPGPKGNKAGGARNHYETISLEDIKALPVESIAEDDCMLFMWATWPLMPIWNDVITSWGFKYKTLGWEWVKTTKGGKPRIGAGAYTRSNCEPLLIGVRGKAASLVGNHGIVNVVLAERTVHSAKPSIFRHLITELVGDRTRIELFARRSAPGWDVWGDQAESPKEQTSSILLKY